MNTYRIRYRREARKGTQYVQADSVNGFEPTCDTYLFKIGPEVVAAIPKVNVVSVEKVEPSRSDDE